MSRDAHLAVTVSTKFEVDEPQSRFARLWLDSQHDNLPKGIRTIKMCKLYSNDALVTVNGLASIVKENV